MHKIWSDPDTLSGAAWYVLAFSLSSRQLGWTAAALSWSTPLSPIPLSTATLVLDTCFWRLEGHEISATLLVPPPSFISPRMTFSPSRAMPCCGRSRGSAVPPYAAWPWCLRATSIDRQNLFFPTLALKPSDIAVTLLRLLPLQPRCSPSPSLLPHIPSLSCVPPLRPSPFLCTTLCLMLDLPCNDLGSQLSLSAS